MFDKLFSFLCSDLGIDLGTANVLVSMKDRGIVLAEPSVVAVRRGTNEVVPNGVGLEAKRMLGKTPANIQAIRPLKDGVIADFAVTEAMLKYFLRKVNRHAQFFHPRIVMAVPSGITAVEKKAVRQSAERAGARKVYLVPEPEAAGVGVGLPVAEPVGSMICDIGGGTTEVAVLSLGDVVTYESIRIAGDEMDEAIINHMKRTHNLMVGEQTAERIKIEIGSATPDHDQAAAEVCGRDIITGLPKKVTITGGEIREALSEPISAIIAALKNTLERTAPELAGDLVYNGMVLAGGGALLRGLDQVIARETGIPCVKDDDPLTAVARGTQLFVENLDRWKDYLDDEDSG